MNNFNSNENDTKSELLFQREINDTDVKSDDKIDSDDEVINILREKTFNRELRQLVNRVIGNESDDLAYDDLTDKEETSTQKRELLLKFHQLFYKVKNLTELEDVNTYFNPFKNIKPNYDLNYAVNRFINDELNLLSFSSYAVLSYNYEKKCFYPLINKLKKINNTNTIISMRDNLYNEISRSPYGMIIDRPAIENDSFLTKKFAVKDKTETGSFYFLLINRISTKFISELNNTKINKSLSILPYPILIIQLGNGTGFNEREIFQSLEERLSIPLFIYEDNILDDYMQRNPFNFDNLFIIKDYLEQIYLNRNDGIVIIIESKKNYSKKILILLEYIFNKLNSIVQGDSIILRIVKNKFIIFTNNMCLKPVKEMIDEYNLLFNNCFDIDSFSCNKYNSFEEIFKEALCIC